MSSHFESLRASESIHMTYAAGPAKQGSWSTEIVVHPTLATPAFTQSPLPCVIITHHALSYAIRKTT